LSFLHVGGYDFKIFVDFSFKLQVVRIIILFDAGGNFGLKNHFWHGKRRLNLSQVSVVIGFLQATVLILFFLVYFNNFSCAMNI